MDNYYTNRRDFFAGIAAASFGIATENLLSSKDAMANWGLIAPGAVPDDNFDGRCLVNKSRAYEIMDRENIDAIVALNPVNVFYLGNYFSYELQKLRAIPSFAVMPRDENKPIILVISSSDLWFIANGDREYPEIIPYSAPQSWEHYHDPEIWSQEPGAIQGMRNFPAASKLTEIEKGWLEIENRFKNTKSATPEWALVRALKESGVINGRIAVDDMRIKDILNTLEIKSLECLPGDNTFRKIRMVKSEVELKHMKKIAKANQKACMAMLAKIEVGMDKNEIDKMFLIETAKNHAKAMWLAIGTIGGFIDGKVVEGRPMMVDAVSQINFYHGDFGRTWCIGEPRKDVLERVKILKAGAEIAHDFIKPGVKYSELRKYVSDAIAKINTAPSGTIFGPGPHSVGLQHTDQPYRDNLPFQVNDDLEFEENMTLTVDMPSLEPGWGGAHLEDLIVVKKNGIESLSEIDNPLVII